MLVNKSRQIKASFCLFYNSLTQSRSNINEQTRTETNKHRPIPYRLSQSLSSIPPFVSLILSLIPNLTSTKIHPLSLALTLTHTITHTHTQTHKHIHTHKHTNTNTISSVFPVTKQSSDRWEFLVKRNDHYYPGYKNISGVCHFSVWAVPQIWFEMAVMRMEFGLKTDWNISLFLCGIRGLCSGKGNLRSKGLGFDFHY